MVQSIEDARRRSRGGSARVPPHNLQAEESLLGAMLLSKDAIAQATELCSADDFYKPAHGHVFEAVQSLYGQGAPADPVTVADELRRAGLLDAIGGPAVLTDLQGATPAISNAGHYARIVEELALLRRLIGVAGEIAEIGYSMPDDVGAAVDEAESMVFDVAQRRVTDSVADLRTLLSASLDRLAALYDRGDAIIGTPTGYLDLDERLSGLQPSSLVIVGARPGSGKTAFALGAAAHAAVESHLPVLFFSLEMSHDEVTQRLLSSEAKVDATRLRNGKLADADWDKISHAIGRLSEAPLYIDDNPNLTVMEMRAKARRLKSRVGKLSLIVVDYLQLMTGRRSAENRQVEVSEISRGLKILARELETPVVAVSQLSRNLENRADKRPMLADLRESGCMPAGTRLLRADTGEEVTLGELVLSQEEALVWSVDDDHHLAPARVINAFPSGVKPVFRLRLASGREVEATADHRFLTAGGWSRLDSLGPGSFVAVPRRVPAPAAPAAGWDDDELVLLAHLLGRGTIGPAVVRYVTDDPANRRAVEGAASRALGLDFRGRLVGPAWIGRLPGSCAAAHRRHPVRAWLEPLGLWAAGPADRFVPESVHALPDPQLALFLRHLWAASGSISLSCIPRGRRVNVQLTTPSRRLAAGVQRALVRFGIRSRLSSPDRRAECGAWRVTVRGVPDQIRFLTTVGAYGRQAEVVPAALVALEAAKPEPGVDLARWQVAQEVRQVLRAGIPDRRVRVPAGGGGGAAVAPDGPEPPAGPVAGGRGRGALLAIAEVAGSDRLRALATPDLLWDEAVEVVALGLQPTFDATVEGTHNFVANGVVAHNSLEQDADVVIFIYRDELYNPESADRGVAEIIVAKHRSGPVGTERLAFLDRYTRFANMARV
ncbi:MAG TPA: replicative DNA helicase [Acidimicrobiales bacterium]|nr:replicative DNA helicase [Acidimicrobiales bacterium]